MDFQTIRIYGSIAVILGCFLFLYPKLLHPVFMTLLGMNTSPKDQKADDFVPPALRDRPGMGGPGGDLPDHIKKMRHGPHPGMRAAAAEQSKQTKGSGRGMMGVILPMYAVGIVVYLVYTLFKVFGKNDKSGSRRGSPSREPRSEYDVGQQGDEQGRVSGKKGDTLTEQDLKGQLEKLHSLANTVKGNDMKEMDMRKLQERLAETEAQMTKILAAMQAVQTKVVDAPTDKTETSKDVKPEEKTTEKTEDKKDPSNGGDRSSEESESYEIINKSDRESSCDENSPTKVETLTSEGDQNKIVEQEEDEKCQEDEVKEEILKDKEENSGDEAKTVRKRVTKKEAES
ncbi:resistance to inhibitors of cholinesterase protein 3-like isoform X1 [Ruditapes philippinarum]|uniref:resistance to inhibitors of cholinesterase protein 3-like isoform X1 n=1 Tax=Ruditapes philippinarum TaxID=129788 RepID=UPI00295ABEAA|nr:resistance to inhibitors of cholinesterase protein 3-like isoform X1 [Ruditapes philippinarum]